MTLPCPPTSWYFFHIEKSTNSQALKKKKLEHRQKQASPSNTARRHYWSLSLSYLAALKTAGPVLHQIRQDFHRHPSFSKRVPCGGGRVLTLTNSFPSPELYFNIAARRWGLAVRLIFFLSHSNLDAENPWESLSNWKVLDMYFFLRNI